MAGSLGLNKRFAEAVNNLVGDDQFHKLRKTKAFALAEKYFDRDVKKAFRGKKGEEYFVNFPMAGLKDDKGSGLESNCWRLTQWVFPRPATVGADVSNQRLPSLGRPWTRSSLPSSPTSCV